MADDTQNPGGTSDPFVIDANVDIDAAIAQAKERMDAARNAETKQEQDDDQTTDQTTTTVGEPDEDETADVEAEETKTPAETTQPRRTDSQEPQKQQTDEEDEPVTLSRKQRGNLIKEIRTELEESERLRKELETKLAEQKANDEKLTAEVNRALGTDEEYEKANDEGLAGDDEQAKKARIWKANRAFFKKLVDKAQRDTEQGFYASYWDQVSGLPGIKPEVLQKGTLSEILKHTYDAGVSSVEGKGQEEIAKLKEEVDTWKGRYAALKPKSGAQKAKSPLGGGGGDNVSGNEFDWRKKYTDPKTGLLTDEADRIVARYGFGALKDPSLIKAR